MGAGCPPSVPGGPRAPVLESLQDHWLLLFHFQNFCRFFPPLQTLMGSQGGSLHSAGQTLLLLFSKCNFGTCLARKICFSPQRADSGRSWAEAGEPASVVGKRLTFPWNSSLLIPVFSPFLPSCFTFALADRIYCSSSPCNNFCPGSSHMSLLGWGLLTLSDDQSLSTLLAPGFVVNPKLQLLPTATSALGQGGCTHQGTSTSALVFV